VVGVEARKPRCNLLHRRNANNDTALHTVNAGLRRDDGFVARRQLMGRIAANIAKLPELSARPATKTMARYELKARGRRRKVLT